MPKFAANLTMLFNEDDFLDRFAARPRRASRASNLFPYAFQRRTGQSLAARPRAGAAQHAGG